MGRILILNGNDLERHITEEILTSGMGAAVEVMATATADEAIEMLRDGSIDLFIPDVGWFDMNNCNMISAVRKLAPDTPIMVTSAGNQEDISCYVWQLGIRDYLLKPYRPAWLLSAANALMRHQTRSGDGFAGELQEALDNLAEYLRRFQYKKCTDVAREYLDLLHENADNRNEIRMGSVAFAEGMAEAAKPLSSTIFWKLTGCLEHFRVRFDWQERKYDSYIFMVRMLDMIFDSMEASNVYEVGSEQKILNFIDRNIRRGISLDEVAEYSNMSSCYFSKLFKRMTGENFIAYVTNSKLELAKQMLTETDMPVTNVAYELSYNETNYFSKAFKKKTGMTPGEYRRTVHPALMQRQGAG